MEQKRTKVRLTENSPYSDYGYYERGDIGYIDGYVNNNAVIILENGKFAKADLTWIEVVNEEDKNVNSELAESEGEMIRKYLLFHFFHYREDEIFLNGITTKQIVSWLEKQGEIKPLPSDYDKAFDEFLSHIPEKDPESSNSLYTYEDLESAIQFGIRWQKEQKPAWSEEDETNLNDAIDACKAKYGNMSYTADWLKDLKGRVQPQPKQEWDEKDKCMLNNVIDTLKPLSQTTHSGYAINSMIDWLKSLIPQPQWKPSKEQIMALRWVLNNIPYNMQKEEISGLLDQIKDL